MNSFRALRLSRSAVGSAFIAALIFAFASAWPAFAAPIITATKDDNLAAGLRKLPGNTITYTTTISNTGDATATSVLLTDPDPANTTFVSVNSPPLARHDIYSGLGHVRISIPVGSGVRRPCRLPHSL